MPRLLTGLLALVGFTFAVPCAASEHESSMHFLAGSESAWAQRPLVLDARLGLPGSPSGVVGVGVGYSVVPALSLSAAVGAGINGPQYEAMARLRAFSVSSESLSYGLYVGVGASEGEYKAFTNSDSDSRRWDHAWWGNLEVGLDWQWRSGLSLRAYLGNEWNLSRNAGSCYRGRDLPVEACGDDGHVFPYFGLAVGYGFSP